MPEPAAISLDLVRQELDRLMDSAALRRSPSHMRLLRYLVEKRLAGDDSALRETAIALDVFRRDPNTYDPQTDPIVRVTTGRLRLRLATHYDAYGSTPRVRIVLPKGTYAPEFTDAALPAEAVGLAVLATRNQTGEPALDARCEAFADRLRDHLGEAGVPHVQPRNVSGDAGEAAWLMESTLAREYDRELRLSIRFVHAADGALRWVETAVAPAGEVQSLMDRMLDFVLLRTVDTLPSPPVAGATGSPTTLSRAQRTALDQAHLMLVQRNLRGTEDAVALAQAAVDERPDDADAWSTLGAALYSRLSFMDRDETLLMGALRASVERALAISSEHPVALRTKAILVGKCDYDVASAEKWFRRALRSLPRYTSARLNLAEILALQGKASEALAELNLARLYDPLSPSVLLAKAICLDLVRMYDEAAEAWGLCAAVGEASLWVLTGVGMHYLMVGDVGSASPALEDALQRHPDSPATLLACACLHARRGDRARALRAEGDCVERFPHASTAGRAVIAAWLGDRDRLLSLLAQARVRKDMDLLQTAVHPALDPYARDAEVQRLLPLGPFVNLR